MLLRIRKTNARRKIVLLSALVSTTLLMAQSEADKICGLYYVVDKFTSGEQCKVRIYRTNKGTYEAQVVWMNKPYNDDGTLRRDVNNPDPALRNTPCNRVVMMRNLTYNADEKEWQNGEVYNPQNGRFYRSYMSFESDKKLRVRGYWGISLLGLTMYWDKIE